MVINSKVTDKNLKVNQFDDIYSYIVNHGCRNDFFDFDFIGLTEIVLYFESAPDTLSIWLKDGYPYCASNNLIMDLWVLGESK